MNLLRASTTVGGFTMLSRVFGFIRDILIANFLGAGALADAFVVAFRLPNLFRRLFAEGAFAAAFVPIFSGLLETEGEVAAKRFATDAFSALGLILVAFVAFCEVAMPGIVFLIAGGFDETPEKLVLATELSRIAFPYLLFISLVSLQSGVLNSLGRFAAAAATPVLLNLTLISALAFFAGYAETPAHALTWGVFAAGIIQFAWLAAACRRQGFVLRPKWPEMSPEIRTLGMRILPVVFGASLYQINLLIGTRLASELGDGPVSYLFYADRVIQFPLGVVGVAVGTALLPLLSRQFKAGDFDGAMESQNRGLEFALLLTVPAAAALIAVPETIVGVLFERGRFDADATAATAAAVWAFSVGLPAFVLIRVLTPAFFAREDTKTPVRIAAWAMLANIVLNLILMQIWGHVGIALASSLSAWLNALGLAVILRRRDQLVMDHRLQQRIPRIVVASLLMCLCLFAIDNQLGVLLSGGEAARILGLVFIVASGMTVYGIAAHVLGAARLGELLRQFRRPRAES